MSKNIFFSKVHKNVSFLPLWGEEEVPYVPPSKNLVIKNAIKLRNGHSGQIRETRMLLARICRGESHFSRKWPLACVGESGESAQHGSANVGESGESGQQGSANVGESGESAQYAPANVGASVHDKIGRFKHK